MPKKTLLQDKKFTPVIVLVAVFGLLLISGAILSSPAGQFFGPDNFCTTPFVRGDANNDGTIDIADPIFISDYLFSSGPAPPCLESADSNDDGDVNVADPVFISNFLFANGTAPHYPYPEPGYDEPCDGIDNDNDNYIDEGCPSCEDFDLDAYCRDVDCNDFDPLISPDAPEICDGKDNNCDGQTDEQCIETKIDVEISNLSYYVGDWPGSDIISFKLTNNLDRILNISKYWSFYFYPNGHNAELEGRAARVDPIEEAELLGPHDAVDITIRGPITGPLLVMSEVCFKEFELGLVKTPSDIWSIPILNSSDVVYRTKLKLECTFGDLGCQDTDGLNYNLKGRTTNLKTGVTSTDYCHDNKIVVEYFCFYEKAVTLSSHNCSVSCFDGACLEEPPRCVNDSQCAPNFQCKNGNCVEIPLQALYCGDSKCNYSTITLKEGEKAKVKVKDKDYDISLSGVGDTRYAPTLNHARVTVNGDEVTVEKGFSTSSNRLPDDIGLSIKDTKCPADVHVAIGEKAMYFNETSVGPVLVGEGIKISNRRSNFQNNLTFGDYINYNYKELGKIELPNLLKDSSIVDDNGVAYSYSQEIIIGNKKIHYGKPQMGSDALGPNAYIDAGKDPLNAPIYTYEVIFNNTIPVDGLSSIFGKTLSLFGKDSLIYGFSSDNLYLLDSGISVLMNEGDTKKILLEGIEYEVKILGVASPTRAVIAVNGVSKTVSKGSSYLISGLNAYIEDIFYLSEQTEISQVKIYFGGKKTTLPKDGYVRTGLNETIAYNAYSKLGMDGEKLKNITVYFAGNNKEPLDQIMWGVSSLPTEVFPQIKLAIYYWKKPGQCNATIVVGETPNSCVHDCFKEMEPSCQETDRDLSWPWVKDPRERGIPWLSNKPSYVSLLIGEHVLSPGESRNVDILGKNRTIKLDSLDDDSAMVYVNDVNANVYSNETGADIKLENFYKIGDVIVMVVSLNKTTASLLVGPYKLIDEQYWFSGHDTENVEVEWKTYNVQLMGISGENTFAMRADGLIKLMEKGNLYRISDLAIYSYAVYYYESVPYSDSAGGAADICASDSTLTEYFCASGAKRYLEKKSTNCSDLNKNGIAYICEMGECVPTVSAISLDSDSDGIPDSLDNCPDVFNPKQGECTENTTGGGGGGVGAPKNKTATVNKNKSCPDTDSDGICDEDDNCIGKSNAKQTDADADSIGDECDNCPNAFNPDQKDSNRNGLGDACDNPLASIIQAFMNLFRRR